MLSREVHYVLRIEELPFERWIFVGNWLWRVLLIPSNSVRKQKPSVWDQRRCFVTEVGGLSIHILVQEDSSHNNLFYDLVHLSLIYILLPTCSLPFIIFIILPFSFIINSYILHTYSLLTLWILNEIVIILLQNRLCGSAVSSDE